MSRGAQLVVVVVVIVCLAFATRGAEAQADAPTFSALDAVHLALKQNPDGQSAAAELTRAEHNLSAADSRYVPVLLLDAGYTHTENPSLNLGGVVTPRVNQVTTGAELRKRFALGTDVSARVQGNYQRVETTINPAMPDVVTLGPGYGLRARISVTQPLLRGAGHAVNLAELRSARLERSAALHARDRVLSQLVRDVLQAHWELWVTAQTLDIERRNRESALLQRDDALARERTGTLATADVLSFEVRVAAAEEAIENAEANYATRRAQLRRLLGTEPEGAPGGEPPLPERPTGDLRELALGESPAVLAQRAQVALARQRAEVASDPSRARLDLTGYVETQGLGNENAAPALRQSTTLEAVSAHVSLSYEAPLTRARERAQAASAGASVEIAERALESLELSLGADLDAELSRFDAARRRIDLARRTVALAAAQRDAQVARFQSGSARALDVVQAEDTVRDAELRLLRARADLVQSHAALLHLTGQLVRSFEVSPPGS